MFCLFAWFLALLTCLEFYGRLVHRKGIEISARYSTNKELRFVTEAFHHTLWDIPWITYKPNTSIEFTTENQHYQCKINKFGFRGSTALESKQSSDGPLVIACIGGSTTVEGITDDQTYPSLLEKQLRDTGHLVCVLNGGIAGLDSLGYQNRIQTIQSSHNPKLLVEYNAVNDICWRLFPYWIKDFTRLKVWAIQSVFFKQFLGDMLVPQEEKIRLDVREFIINNLNNLATECKDANVTLFVCSFAYPQVTTDHHEEYAYYDYNLRHWWSSLYISYTQYCRIVDIYNEELRANFLNTSVKYIPVQEIGEFEPDDFLDICHMKPSGTQKKAKVIAEYISKSFKLPKVPNIN